MKTGSFLIVLAFIAVLPKYGFAQKLDSQTIAKLQDIKRPLNSAQNFSPKLASKFEMKNLATSLKELPNEALLRGGAGIDGGGSDGLEMENVSTLNGSVTVPVPGSLITKYGYLRVDGKAGPQQDKRVGVSKCQTDVNGEPLRFGCGSIQTKIFDLNTSTKLRVGTYIVFFSQTMEFIKITEGNTMVLSLVKIQVPKSSEPIKFNVFWDLTSPEMQELELELSYSNTVNGKFLSEICASSLTKIKALCEAYQKKDFHALLNTLTRYHSDGSYDDLANSGEFMSQGRYYVVDPRDGDFVSVLPGVYGIEFTNPATGETQSQYGIVAQ